MKYVNAQQNTIDAGPDWQSLDFQGQYIPCAPGNPDYDKIVRENMEVLPCEAPSPAVPVSVTANAARKALNAAGLRQAVENAVAAASQDIKDDWEYAATIRRHSPTVMALSAALGLSDAQLDALFIHAEELSR